MTLPFRGGLLSFLIIAAFALANVANTALATGQARTPVAVEERVRALLPEIEAYTTGGMKAFDLPGLGMGIVVGDKLVYAKGFGVRGKAGGAPVDPRTVFQIGSTAKAFLTTTMAIMVDRGKLRWDDRVVDRDPEFQLKDPWVTREFRVFDLAAQRSGLPPYANDLFIALDFDESALIRSLRYVEPVSSFRTTFAYTNITHLQAGRVVAKAAGAADWNAVLRKELLEPLGLKDSSYTVEGISGTANHANGHLWTPAGTSEIPFNSIQPYHAGGAGDINSTVEDMARWVRMQLDGGTFEGRRLVSAENLAYTRTAKVAMSEQATYALGWMNLQTPNGNVIWHNGGTDGFGAFVGMVPDRSLGVILLSNETNMGCPDALGLWVIDRILDNPKRDLVAETLKLATAKFEKSEKQFARPATPRPSPPLAPLAGKFHHPALGAATVAPDGDALVMELQATGARLNLEPWDGDVFLASLMPTGRFAAVVAAGVTRIGFAQFQMDRDGKPNLLRLLTDDGQPYEFRRQ